MCVFVAVWSTDIWHPLLQVLKAINHHWLTRATPPLSLVYSVLLPSISWLLLYMSN